MGKAASLVTEEGQTETTLIPDSKKQVAENVPLHTSTPPPGAAVTENERECNGDGFDQKDSSDCQSDDLEEKKSTSLTPIDVASEEIKSLTKMHKISAEEIQIQAVYHNKSKKQEDYNLEEAKMNEGLVSVFPIVENGFINHKFSTSSQGKEKT